MTMFGTTTCRAMACVAWYAQVGSYKEHVACCSSPRADSHLGWRILPASLASLDEVSGALPPPSNHCRCAVATRLFAEAEAEAATAVRQVLNASSTVGSPTSACAAQNCNRGGFDGTMMALKCAWRGARHLALPGVQIAVLVQNLSHRRKTKLTELEMASM